MKSFTNTTGGHWSWVGAVAAVGLAVLSLLGVTGCASTRARSEAQTEQDQALAQNVSSALAASPVYKYQGVHVTADQGTVELKGIVPTAAQKDAAGDIAKRVPGVARVDNDLSIQPLPGSPEVGATVPPAPPPPSQPY